MGENFTCLKSKCAFWEPTLVGRYVESERARLRLGLNFEICTVGQGLAPAATIPPMSEVWVDTTFTTKPHAPKPLTLGEVARGA